MSNAIRRTMVWLVSINMVFMGTPVLAQADSYAAALARLDEAIAEVEQIRSLIDRTAFDLDALSFELFMEDAAGLEAWVTENVAYQPYAGLLRGAEGTLMNRAGNALDQAVLLATLMNGSGYEARIASGSLTEEQATQLLQTASAAPERDYSELRQKLADVPGLDADILLDNSPDAERLLETAVFSGAMVTALDAAGLQLGQDQPDLLADAADYYWVEYRLGAEDWAAAHPAASFLSDAGLVAETYLDSEIPAELQHRIRLEVLVESFDGGSLKVTPVVPAWERPAANMAGTVITYSNQPNQDGGSIAESLEQSDYFMPAFMGSVPRGAMGFDMLGAVLEPEFQNNPMAGVVRNIRGGFMDAIGAMGGMDGGKSSEPLALSAQWLVVTQIAPGGQEREHRRTVFDRIGEEARAAGLTTLDAMTIEEAEIALIAEYRLMAFPGELPVDYLLDVMLERMVQGRDLLEYTIALQHGVTPPKSLEDSVADSSPMELLMAMNMFDTGPAGSVSYRAEPGLVIFSDSLVGTREESGLVSSLDIMHNARRVVNPDSALLALDQGVWETLTERDIMGDTTRNTANFGTDFTVLAAGSTAPEDLGGEARFNMQRDLDQGYAVMLPEDSDSWWRVNLATGETLGITSDGRGQSTAEYLNILNNATTVLFSIKSYDECTKGGAGFEAMEAQLCCLMKAHTNNVVGLGMGGLITGAIGGATGQLFSLAYSFGTAATGADVTPHPMNIC